MAKKLSRRNEVTADELYESLITNAETKHIVGVLLLASFCVIPLFLTPTQLLPFISVIFISLFGISWDVVSGYTGQLSLGHAFFFAIGGYGATVLNLQHGLDPITSIIIATMIAGLTGLAIGIPALRLSGPYLALVTLVAPLILLRMFTFWRDELIVTIGSVDIPIAPNGFGGGTGIATPPSPIVATRPDALITVQSFQERILFEYYLSLGLMLLIIAGLLIMMRSHIGDILTAIKANEKAVSAAGINVAKFKIFSFFISSVVAGFSAAVYVHTIVGFAQPGNLLNTQLSFEVIIISVIGGLGTILGPIVGLLVISIVELVMSMLNFQLPFSQFDFSSLSIFAIFGIAILLLYYMPKGVYPRLTGLAEEVADRWDY
jgi:branched-chain amino acid transport system permease protein